MAGQALRSGTSPAPNYGEARGAESVADFVHKLRIVLKELNETAIWLRLNRTQPTFEKRIAGRHYQRKRRALQNLYRVSQDSPTAKCQMKNVK